MKFSLKLFCMLASATACIFLIAERSHAFELPKANRATTVTPTLDPNSKKIGIPAMVGVIDENYPNCRVNNEQGTVSLADSQSEDRCGLSIPISLESGKKLKSVTTYFTIMDSDNGGIGGTLYTRIPKSSDREVGSFTCSAATPCSGTSKMILVNETIESGQMYILKLMMRSSNQFGDVLDSIRVSYE